MEISKMQKDAHQIATQHGFYDDISMVLRYLEGNYELKTLQTIAKRSFVLGQLSKVASEVGEAVDAIQHGDVDNPQLMTELADIVIRVADLAGFLEGNLDHAIAEKMKANRNRPYKHGKIC